MGNLYEMDALNLFRQPSAALRERLTPRQLEVLALLCEGLPNTLIGRRLNISSATVKIHVANLPLMGDEALSVLWLITCMNAFNILDVSDGLATTAGLVGAAGMFAVATLNGEPTIATLAAALFGACFGFLRFNRPPARMYLGDTGSMFLGAVLGALAMTARYSATNTVSAWFVPLVILAAPLFDLGLVIIARLRAGRPIYYGSPDHFAVRLRHNGWSARRVAVASGVGGVIVSVAGICSTLLPNRGALLVLGSVLFIEVSLLVIILSRYPPRPVPEVPPPSAQTPSL